MLSFGDGRTDRQTSYGRTQCILETASVFKTMANDGKIDGTFSPFSCLSFPFQLSVCPAAYFSPFVCMYLFGFFSVCLFLSLLVCHCFMHSLSLVIIYSKSGDSFCSNHEQLTPITNDITFYFALFFRVALDIRPAGYPAFFDIRYSAGYPVSFAGYPARRICFKLKTEDIKNYSKTYTRETVCPRSLCPFYIISKK